jgi:hypothetical protein
LRTTKSIRNEILKKNPSVTSVGIIPDWTNSDHKYIALELILKDEKILLLTSVNYKKLPDREPFKLNRVGNYAFATIYHFVNKQTNRSEVELRTNQRYSLSELREKIGVQVDTISDVINKYDDIAVFLDSLPTVNKYNYQDLIDGEFVFREEIPNEYYFVKTLSVKTIWSDKYYGTEIKDGKECSRKPDYDNNQFL